MQRTEVVHTFWLIALSGRRTWRGGAAATRRARDGATASHFEHRVSDARPAVEAAAHAVERADVGDGDGTVAVASGDELGEGTFQDLGRLACVAKVQRKRNVPGLPCPQGTPQRRQDAGPGRQGHRCPRTLQQRRRLSCEG